MDYDDEDFQNQNFQLVCEGSALHSSVEVYPFPRYVRDENHHTGLDFLVEKEVLLGIHNQQDDDWIDDFSRGNNGVEFNLSVSESCSISWNNVWSEATSSASVEGLSKSIDQDEERADQLFGSKLDAAIVESLTDEMDTHVDKNLLGLPKVESVSEACFNMPPDRSVENLPAGDLTDYPPPKGVLPSCKDKGCGSEIGTAGGNCTAEKCDSDQKAVLSTISVGQMVVDEDHSSALSEASSCGTGNNVLEVDQVHQISKSEPTSTVDFAVSNENDHTVELKGSPELMVNENSKLSPNDAVNGKCETSHDSQMEFMVKNKSLCTDGGAACELNEKVDDAIIVREKTSSAAGQEEVLVEASKDDDAQILSSETSHRLLKESEQDGLCITSSRIEVPQFYDEKKCITDDARPDSSDAAALCKLDKSVETDSGNLETSLELQGTCILDLPCKAGEPRTIDSSCTKNGRSSIKSNDQRASEIHADKQVLTSEDKAGNAIARDKILGENDQTRDVAMETASKRASRPSNFDGDKVVSEISLKPCSLSKVDPGKFVECESSGLLPQKVTESSTSCKGSVEITQNDDKCGGCSIPWSDSVDKERCPKTGKQNQKDAEGVSSSKVDSLKDDQGEVSILSSVTTSLELHPETMCGSPTIISSKEQSKIDDITTGDLGKALSLTDRNPSVVKSNIDCASDDDRSFSFAVVEDAPDADNNKGWQPFCNAQSSQSLQVENQVQASGLCQNNDVMSQDDSQGRKKLSKAPIGTTKAASVNKRKSLSHSAPAKEATTKEKMAAKRTATRKKRTDKGANSAPGFEEKLSQALQPHQMQLSSGIESRIVKQSDASIIQTSYVPDSNSLLSSTLFHQPFTDVQQVQLRAQIFVYGSLIQGTAPDEACMLSAFRDSSQDEGKSAWEATWKIAVGRLNCKQSPIANSSFSSHTGDFIQSKATASQTNRVGIVPNNSISCSMGVSSPIRNATSLSQDGLQLTNSPGGHVLDYYHSLSVLHPYQSPQMKQYMGNTLPWLSQPSVSSSHQCRPQAATFDAGKQYGMLSAAESVQVAPVQELFASNASTVQTTVPTTLSASLGPVNVLPAAAVSIEPQRTTPFLSGKHAADGQKSRKNRKNASSEVIQGQIVSHSKGETISMPHDASKPILSAAVVSSTSMPASSILSACHFATKGSSNHPSAHFQVVSPGEDMQNVVPAANMYSRSEQEKLPSEDDASIATSAVIQCQRIWNQLSVQKNSGLVSDIEAKLAAAAVAATAAALVARAASAAAKLATDSVFKAKVMVDEAVKAGNITSELSSKANERASIIVAAKEAARKRVEAASAAARRAENLDAIVRAAEVAADSVAQAGTIVAMTEPVAPKLSELIERSPEGFWRLKPASNELRGDPSYSSSENVAARKLASGDLLRENEFQDRVGGEKECASCKVIPPREDLGGVGNTPVTTENSLGRGHLQEESDVLKAAIAKSNLGPERPGPLAYKNDQSKTVQLPKVVMDGDIKEGSIVEVLSNEDGLRGTWFSAKVCELKDGQAFVCYDELCEDKGTDRLKEWIPLKGEGDVPSRLRVAGPIIAPVKYEGTRKRRRAAMGNCMLWSVGDQVDVWMHGGWREATISEKDENDDTKLTVQFSVEGDSSVARAWNLRPSFRWKDGKWTECTRQKDSGSHEGDTPQEKRRKFRGANAGRESKIENSKKDELSKDMAVDNAKKMEESYSISETVDGRKNSDPTIMKRTGLQKEGAKVIFGIPKPGKKRKFMDVSKHCVADKPVLQTAEETDLMKFTKYLMPQGPSRGWNSTPKVDSRVKQPSNPKPKITRAGKAQTMQIVTDSATHSTTEPSSLDIVQYVKGSVNEGESTLSEERFLEVDLSSNPQMSCEIAMASDAIGGSADENEGNELCADDDGKGKLDSSVVEPRRSSRKIQPTSRLLEGLQSSSLVVSKMPVISHDMEAKLHNGNSLSSKGNSSG